MAGSLYGFAYTPSAFWDNDRKNCRLSNIRWASQQENVDDMVRHETVLFGEKNPGAKLTADKVREIRALKLSGQSLTKIASKYNIGFQQVSRIVNKTRWGHVE